MQPTEWEKLFTNDMASMELISKTLKNYHTFNDRKTNNPI